MFVEIFEEMLTLIGGLIVVYFIYVLVSKKNDKTATSTAQMALKELVERVVEGFSEKEKEDNTSDRSYEDLLATAILNKVIEKFQNEFIDGNRNVLREKSTNKSRNSEIETGFEKGQEEGSSSLEPMLTIEERIEEVTTYNNEEEDDVDFRNIRRVPFPEYGMDFVDPSQSGESEDEREDSIQDIVTPVESWEENWLFQKRKIQALSEPVAMLVPNASEDYRALIGEQNAEDISDLSECSAQSDEEIDQELKFVIRNVVPQSVKSESLELNNFEAIKSSSIPEGHKTSAKNVENGKHKEIVEKGSHNSKANNRRERDTLEFHEKEEMIFDRRNKPEEIPSNMSPVVEKNQNYKKEQSNIKMVNDSERESNLNYIKASECNLQKSSQNFENKFKKTEFTNCVDGEDEIQQESEYTEHYDTATQKHMDSLTKVYGPMGIDEVDDEKPPTIIKTSPPPVKKLGKCRDFATPPRPGTIAEREHKKWENAPPIENNPYSEENIQRRLLERQYTISEISGSNISKSTGKLQIELGAKHLDVKRFRRDYYINDAMNERQTQHSNPGSDSDKQQDKIRYDSKRESSENGKSKFSSCHQRNNELNKDEMNEIQSLDLRSSTNSEVEKLLEKKRRNNKNEINARLNNQESGNIHEPIDEKKIRRLDLRAYGFENDFRFQNCETSKSSQQRMVNKLDLKSFGYECGLRRTLSIHLDSRNHGKDQKPKNKLNLTEKKEFQNCEDNNFDLTKSTEDLNREPFQDGNYFSIRGMFSAQSVPNITNSQLYESGIDVSTIRCKYEKKFIFQKDKTEKEKRHKIRNKTNKKLMENLLIQNETEKSEGDAIPLLPSVKRLAQEFTERLKVSKSTNRIEKERPTTPEIHLLETPHIHSLTARSISKEFREGLSQIAQKITSPSMSHGQLEQKICENQTNSENNRQSLIDHISIVSPGNLKNNIQFWEQLQKQN